MRWSHWASSKEGARLCWFLIFIVALGTLVARVPRLKMRPMHTDEAVHAAKFADLLEAGEYRYDPNEYHGPTLNYSTLIPARLASQRSYSQITEVTLRIVPVVFSVILILLTLLLIGGLGPAAVAAALLAAVSPAMFFYSRYYIQETLLVCFTFGLIVAGYRYARTRGLIWIAIAGLFAGLMHATKETCIIAFGAMALAVALNVGLNAIRPRAVRKALGRPRFGRPRFGHWALGLAVAVAVSATLCSAFFKHPGAIVDSYRTYLGYLSQAGGHDTVHIHPWYYYLKMLAFAQYRDGPTWSEGGIMLMALVGLAVAVRGRSIAGMNPVLIRFLAFYTVAMTVVYSAVSYKTPWCMLSFLHGMILLAGVGVIGLLAWIRAPLGRGVIVLTTLAVAAHLGYQAYLGSFVYESDSRNPYVYAHPTDAIFLVTQKVADYVAASELGSASMPIQVACSGGDYWPLPWYFRSLQVQWYTAIPASVGPFILISADLQNDLAREIYKEPPAGKRRMLYMYAFDDPYCVEVRPQVELLGFVRKDLWDMYSQRPDPTELIEKARERKAEETRNDVRQQ